MTHIFAVMVLFSLGVIGVIPCSAVAQLTPLSVTTSSYQNPHIPQHTIDGNLSTCWSAQGVGQWIRYDLGSVHRIDQLSIAWFRGKERVVSFAIDVSHHASAWKRVFEGESSGRTAGREAYTFREVAARYVSIVGLGNSKHEWNSMTSVSIHHTSLISKQAVLSCVEEFGSAPNFILCAETATTCSFNVLLNGSTCGELCGSFGSQCLGALDNEGNSYNVIPGSNDVCSTPRVTEICICERSGITPPPPPSSAVLYRVNAAGPDLSAIDSGPDWIRDEGFFSGGSRIITDRTIQGLDSSVPSSTPRAVFETERFNPPNMTDLRYDFMVDAGTRVEVRFYMMNGFNGTSEPGERVFDVEINGMVVLDDVDLSQEFGHQIGGMRSAQVVSDGSLRIVFRRNILAFRDISVSFDATPEDVVTGGTAQVTEIEIIEPEAGENVSLILDFDSSGIDFQEMFRETFMPL